MTAFSAENLKTKALALGFNLVGITRAVPSPTLAAYHRWIDAGMHGNMGYMARPDRVARRNDLNVIVPDAVSIVMVGLDYQSAGFPEELLNDPSRGRIAGYAWGLDYHEVMTPRLEALAVWIREEAGIQFDYKHYVDTGAVLERSHAQQAGMGFIGKNTMLIHPRRGSTFFLGELISTLDFDSYDEAHRETMCGRCTRCLTACPTEAFPQPHVLDARRCISYHTIENKGWIPRQLRADFGNWIFGCDICQDVCPFQRFRPQNAENIFKTADIERAAPRLEHIFQMDDTTFKAIYRGSPIYRIKRTRLIRNACIAAGNSADARLIPYLIQLLYDEALLIRGHAAWALWQLMGEEARRLLTELYDRNEDAILRADIKAMLA